MVLTRLHSPLRFGTLADAGVGPGLFGLAGALSEAFVSGVAGDVLDVRSSFGESHFVIR